MTPGPMDFYGAQQTAHGLQRAYRNDTEISGCGRPKTFFFFFTDHIKIRTKLWHFLRLFWSLQNRKSEIFELAPDPRSALGAPGYKIFSKRLIILLQVGVIETLL